ncbi:MAG: aminopeptidase P family protein [Bacteroidota bacterium]
MKALKSLLLILLIFPVQVQAQTDPYQARRDKLIEKTDKGLIIVVNNGGQDYVTTTGENMNFYYLTGINIIDDVLVIDGKKGQSTIYRKTRPWGPPPEAPAGFELKTTEDFAKDLPRLLYGYAVLWMEMGQLKLLDQAGFGLMRLETIRNITPLINGMRPVKDELETARIRKAAQITAMGVVEAMKASEPGMNEKDIELILDYTWKKLGSTGIGFGSIIGSGPNSTIIHYDTNTRTMQTGDMLVTDVGAELEYYTADITRTFPVSGKFTQEQKDIYNIVLRAQKAAIEAMKPGNTVNDVHKAITRNLNQGLYELGLITDTTQAWQNSIWIIHGWGHHIGLAVHDVSGPYVPGKPEVLEPGMIYTVEPGLYFPERHLETDYSRMRGFTQEQWKAFIEKVEPIFKKYVNIGVRIEDDVLITPTGNEVITSEVPKEVAEIEALMKQKSKFN